MQAHCLAQDSIQMPSTTDAGSTPAGTISATLARFCTQTRWQDVPAIVQHEAKRALVNFFATALAGSRDLALDAAVAVFARLRSGDGCHLIGRAGDRGRTDMLHAASLNAMAGNVHDYDDTHLPTIIHPTAPVAPALFALAQTRAVSGADLLLAFVLGVEVECRLGNAISPGHYQRGWHITSTCGVFGAAAACARLLKLDATQTLWALGNASAQAGGLVETLGTMAKSIGVGNAASNGLLSALLAAQGFSGPAQPIEGVRGFLRVTGDAPDFASVVEGLGERWELSNNTYKPYPCGVVLNPVIEACLALHGTLGSEGETAGKAVAGAAPAAGVSPAVARMQVLDQVQRIELTGHPLLRERTDRPGVQSGRASQVSAQHAVAVSLLLGRAGLDEFSDACVANAALCALGSKLVFIDDGSCSVESATLTLRLHGGRSMQHHVAAAKGSLAAPLTDADLAKKMHTLAVWSQSGCAPAPLLDALWTLDHCADAGAIMPLAAGHA